MQNLGCEVRRPPFGTRRDPSMWFTLIFEPERFNAEQARRAQLHGSFRQRERHTLEAREAATESVPAFNVPAGFIEALLGSANAHQPDQCSAEVKTLHHFDETGTLFSDASLGRNPDRIEEKLAATYRSRAQVPEPVPRNARRMQIDVEGTDAASARFV